MLRELLHNARPATGLRLPLPALLQPHTTVGQVDDRRHTVPRGRRPVVLELDVPEVQAVALARPHQVPADDVPARVLGPDLAVLLVVREPGAGAHLTWGLVDDRGEGESVERSWHGRRLPY